MPFVISARSYFPDNFNDGSDCLSALSSRPWYGQINTALIYFLASVALIIFTSKPNEYWWLRALRMLLAVIIGYISIIITVVFKFYIMNAPFNLLMTSNSNSINIAKSECMNIADGGQLVAVLFLGWTVSVIYAVFCSILWEIYHRYKIKLIDKNFKRDGLTRFALGLAAIIILLFIILAVILKKSQIV